MYAKGPYRTDGWFVRAPGGRVGAATIGRPGAFEPPPRFYCLPRGPAHPPRGLLAARLAAPADRPGPPAGLNHRPSQAAWHRSRKKSDGSGCFDESPGRGG
ncbi:hypothetical protein GCM10009760_45320 [Kitasatospora kazusensis]|uniref:Uncharacterized protein n=1 Tax=Kitasatospora kazusensis TaxID=407974 RepID=A0ABN2ZZ92_9ACTN